MKHIAAKIPLLGSSRANKPVIVTDEERAIYTEVQTNLSGMVRLRCWNRTLSAARYWLKRHGATAAEVPVYLENMRDLFHSSNETEYKKRLGDVKVCYANIFLNRTR